jgi:tetraacyldisaccharide 4'-kinase
MNRAASLALIPLSAVYGTGVRLRNALYRRGFLKSFDIGAPVISIGNLTIGGTGKTPLVEFVAAQLAADGRRVCVLTRGYRRQSSDRVVVSDYDQVLADVRAAGDEALLLAERLRGRVAVIADADRVAAACWAIANLQSNIFILDDAFQHQRIQRDLNILTVDAAKPWGNRRVLPAGILREPIKELARADCVVITRANESPDIDQLRHAISQLSPETPVFTSGIKPFQARPLKTAGHPCESLTNNAAPVAAFCGIGNPASFFSLLERQGYLLSYTRAFADHYNYRQSDIDGFIKDAMGRGAKAIVTTAKDAVKIRPLNFDVPCYVVDVAIEIDDVQAFLKCVTDAVKDVKGKKTR